MKLVDGQTDESSLSKLGEEACRLLVTKDFQGLADRFGYALAYGEGEATAIRGDFERCLSDLNVSHGKLNGVVESITVKYFQPNDAKLVAVVECVLLFDKNARTLIELIAAKNGENTNLYLEEISALSV